MTKTLRAFLLNQVEPSKETGLQLVIDWLEADTGTLYLTLRNPHTTDALQLRVHHFPAMANAGNLGPDDSIVEIVTAVQPKPSPDSDGPHGLTDVDPTLPTHSDERKTAD